ncbi:MAG: hypothetical protein EZS28_014919 [Streblomastix strix]|uniref:Uncharacterized protein n=1 Tax=Streblomastix strix TaxID=222440 RepID=A0A5J4W4F3_9EUKA|nr:MAG: hypothetical protein EZS28_014919 [Streblomastix strix]
MTELFHIFYKSEVRSALLANLMNKDKKTDKLHVKPLQKQVMDVIVSEYLEKNGFFASHSVFANEASVPQELCKIGKDELMSMLHINENNNYLINRMMQRDPNDLNRRKSTLEHIGDVISELGKDGLLSIENVQRLRKGKLDEKLRQFDEQGLQRTNAELRLALEHMQNRMQVFQLECEQRAKEAIDQKVKEQLKKIKEKNKKKQNKIKRRNQNEEFIDDEDEEEEIDNEEDEDDEEEEESIDDEDEQEESEADIRTNSFNSRWFNY